jgi:hypothetical protein
MRPGAAPPAEASVGVGAPGRLQAARPSPAPAQIGGAAGEAFGVVSGPDIPWIDAVLALGCAEFRLGIVIDDSAEAANEHEKAEVTRCDGIEDFGRSVDVLAGLQSRCRLPPREREARFPGLDGFADEARMRQGGPSAASRADRLILFKSIT